MCITNKQRLHVAIPIDMGGTQNSRRNKSKKNTKMYMRTTVLETEANRDSRSTGKFESVFYLACLGKVYFFLPW